MSLTVIRGLPGVGKSHYAKNNFGGALVLEGDQRFIQPDGSYVFDGKNRDRSYLTDMLKMAFIHDLKHVIVTTSSSHRASIQELVDVATKFGHDYRVMWLNCSPSFMCNDHGVTEEILAKMRHSWQLFPGETYAERVEVEGTYSSKFQIKLLDHPPRWYTDAHRPCKVIFLDVDGVLNDNFGVRSTEGSFYKDMMEQLRILVKNTRAKIVLHSSWGFCSKMEREVESALYNFGLRLYNNVYKFDDCLFRSSEEINQHDRDWFIKDWLQYHPEITNYVVLDDWDMSSQFPDHFVHTYKEPPFGLSEKVRLQAEAILNKEESK